MPGDGWDALSADATPKPIKSWKKGSSGKSDKPVSSTKTANTIKSFSKTEEGSSHSQDKLGRPNDHYPEIVLLLDGRTNESKVNTTFVVPNCGQALPILSFKGHLCGLQVCHPEQMGEFDYTHGKQRIARTVRVRRLLKKQGYSSTAEFGLISDLRGIPGCKTTPRDTVQEKLQGARSHLTILQEGNQFCITLPEKP